MENNVYSEFFKELIKFILELDIEKEEKVKGCTDEEIKQIEEQFGKLPLAYKEYLKSIGRKFLWSFFDAEQFSYEDYGDIQNFSRQVIESINFVSDKKFIAISHRRYDYLRIIYTNENNEDPQLFYLVDDPEDDEVNPIPSKQTLTGLMMSFFAATLRNHIFTFNSVTDEDLNNDPNIVHNRYINWFQQNELLKKYIDNSQIKNEYVKLLYDTFLDYYNPNKDVIKLKLAQYRNAIAEKEERPQYFEIFIFQKFKHFFKKHL